jgi:hypothetical protein
MQAKRKATICEALEVYRSPQDGHPSKSDPELKVELR